MYKAVILPLSKDFEMPFSTMDGQQKHRCFTCSTLFWNELLILDMKIHIFFHDGGNIGYSWGMIVFPNVFDSMGWLSLDHGHFHDLS